MQVMKSKIKYVYKLSVLLWSSNCWIV